MKGVNKMKSAIVMQTDFTADTSAVCTMYGVCQMVDQELKIFNNTHAIPGFDIFTASISLDYVVDFWPEGTVFVSVVDPGVGTDRKACVAKLKNGQYVVTPDNGSLTHVAEKIGIEEVREIDETINRWTSTKACSIFHGRDLFAYCAARLAAGVITWEEVGPVYPIEEVVMLPIVKPECKEDGTVAGMIQSAGVHFGLVSSNIPYQMLEDTGVSFGDTVEVSICHKGEEKYRGEAKYCKSFGYVNEGEPVVMVSESLTVQIALNLRNFVTVYGIGQGLDWTISFKKAE